MYMYNQVKGGTVTTRIREKLKPRQFGQIREGRESVEEDKYPERPQTSHPAENIEKFSAVVRKNWLQTITVSVEISSATCQWILTRDLNRHSVCKHIVPRMLNEDQSADEVESESHVELKDMAKMDSRNISMTFTSSCKRELPILLYLKEILKDNDFIDFASNCFEGRGGYFTKHATFFQKESLNDNGMVFFRCDWTIRVLSTNHLGKYWVFINLFYYKPSPEEEDVKSNATLEANFTTATMWDKAVGSLVFRASDSNPEGLGSMPDATKYPPSTHEFHEEIVEVEVGDVAINRPFGEFCQAKSYCHLYGAQGQRQAYF
ncbi:hypothetical protein TNCV_4159491 [Trichonephila clavipes]|nr:hypothetical protein TNCV_4159491 [Trichonephila clavipes]